MNLSDLTHYLPPFLAGSEGWGLLLLRLVWGTTLVHYGLPMIYNPFYWLDLGGRPSGFPGFLQAIGAFAIFLGGIAIIVGFLTPLAALSLVGAMAVALGMHVRHGDSFIKRAPTDPGEAYEASLIYLTIALLFLFIGPGFLSLDFLLF